MVTIFGIGFGGQRGVEGMALYMGWALLDRGDRRADVQGSLYEMDGDLRPEAHVRYLPFPV